MNTEQQIKYTINCVECFLNDIPLNKCCHSTPRKMEFIPFDLCEGCCKWLSSPQFVSFKQMYPYVWKHAQFSAIDEIENEIKNEREKRSFEENMKKDFDEMKQYLKEKQMCIFVSSPREKRISKRAEELFGKMIENPELNDIRNIELFQKYSHLLSNDEFSEIVQEMNRNQNFISRNNTGMRNGLRIIIAPNRRNKTNINENNIDDDYIRKPSYISRVLWNRMTKEEKEEYRSNRFRKRKMNENKTNSE